MSKTICGAALAAVLISACGGEGDAVPPPQAPPPPPPPMAAPAPEPTPAPAAEPPKPSLLEMEKVATRVGLAALNAHDGAKFAESFATDGVSVNYGAGESKGREAIASDIQKFFDGFPDFKLAESNIYVKGDMVVIEWVMNGTHKGEFMGVKPTNKPVGIRGATVLWVNADGLVKQEHRYMDGATMMAQIGQSKAPARPVATLPSGETKWYVAKGTPEEDKQTEVAKAMYTAFEKKSEPDFLATVSDSTVWSDITMPKDMNGKADAKKTFQGFVKGFPDAKIAVDSAFAVDEFVIAESTTMGTHGGPIGPFKATKKPVSLHALDVMTVKEGKVALGTSYSNSVEFLAQTGLLPKPKAAKTDAKAEGDKKPAGDKTETKAEKGTTGAKTDKAAPKDAPKADKPTPKAEAPKADKEKEKK